MDFVNFPVGEHTEGAAAGGEVHYGDGEGLVHGAGDVVQGVGEYLAGLVAEAEGFAGVVAAAFHADALGGVLDVAAGAAAGAVKAQVFVRLAPEGGYRWGCRRGAAGGIVQRPDLAPTGVGFVVGQRPFAGNPAGDAQRGAGCRRDGGGSAKGQDVAAVAVG